jgi:hypothetical protein
VDTIRARRAAIVAKTALKRSIEETNGMGPIKRLKTRTEQGLDGLGAGAHYGPVVKTEDDDETGMKVEGDSESAKLNTKMDDESDDDVESNSKIEMDDPEDDEPDFEQN